MTRQYQNPYDQKVSDFIHSKTFRILATLFGTIFGLICLGIVCAVVTTGGSIAYLLDQAYQEMATVGFAPTLQPFEVTAVIQAPELNQPISTQQSWKTVNLNVWQFQIEIPGDWTIVEFGRQSGSVCQYDHDITNYQIDDANGNVKIDIIIICPAFQVRDGEMPPSCPDAFVPLQEYKHLGRISTDIGYEYLGYSVHNGFKDCGDFSWQINSNAIEMLYRMQPGDPPLPIIDQIAMSIRSR